MTIVLKRYITPVTNHHEITPLNTLVRTLYPLLSSFCCLQTPPSFSSFPVRAALKLLVKSLKYCRYKTLIAQRTRVYCLVAFFTLRRGLSLSKQQTKGRSNPTELTKKKCKNYEFVSHLTASWNLEELSWCLFNCFSHSSNNSQFFLSHSKQKSLWF